MFIVRARGFIYTPATCRFPGERFVTLVGRIPILSRPPRENCKTYVYTTRRGDQSCRIIRATFANRARAKVEQKRSLAQRLDRDAWEVGAPLARSLKSR